MKHLYYYSNCHSGIASKLRAMSKSSLVYAKIQCKRMLSDDGIPTWQLSYWEMRNVA